MNITLILGHPKRNSFNHAIAETTTDVLKKLGHHVVFHDLYQEQFNPVMPADEENLPEDELPDEIKKHLHHFKASDGIVIIHPNWWGGPPGILRGWVDRVIRNNSCYNFTKEGVVSHVPGKIVQIFSTSNTPRDIEINVYGDPIEVFWKKVVFGLLSPKSFERRNFESIVLSTEEDRRRWLTEVGDTLRRRYG